MPTLNGDRLSFGLDSAVPTTAPTAWGARLIVHPDGYVDFLHDRQGCAGEDPAALQDILATELPVSVLTEKIGDLLASGKMHIRRAELFTIHTSDKLMVQANTNASAGYCYVAAWLRPEVNGE